MLIKHWSSVAAVWHHSIILPASLTFCPLLGVGMQQARSYREIQSNESKQIPAEIMQDPENYVVSETVTMMKAHC